MKSIVATWLSVVCIASAAHAGAILQVDLLTPPTYPSGAYDPGQIVDFGVSISTDPPEWIQIRLMTLDFRASSPELTFVGPDNYNIGAPGQDGIPEFVFDFSTILGDWGYVKFPNYAVPNVTYTGLDLPLLTIPSNGSLLLGWGQAQLPEVVGTYTLDALNAAGATGGTKLQFDFSNTVTWTAGTGEITGNSPQLVVVPEPATVGLLAVGAVMCVRRQRRRDRYRKRRSSLPEKRCKS